MRAIFHPDLQKKYLKFNRKLQLQIEERIVLFIKDQNHPLLHNHALQGTYNGFSSINITGDYRAIYEVLANDIVRFIDIDTHGKLYSK